MGLNKKKILEVTDRQKHSNINLDPKSPNEKDMAAEITQNNW